MGTEKCTATTKRGIRCKRPAKANGACAVHQKPDPPSFLRRFIDKIDPNTVVNAAATIGSEVVKYFLAMYTNGELVDQAGYLALSRLADKGEGVSVADLDAWFNSLSMGERKLVEDRIAAMEANSSEAAASAT
jgi:hypothetical protein